MQPAGLTPHSRAATDIPCPRRRLLGCGCCPAQLLAFVLATDPLLAGPGWDDVSAEAKSLVGMMLLKDPVERPSAQQLLDAFASWLALGSRP